MEALVNQRQISLIFKGMFSTIFLMAALGMQGCATKPQPLTEKNSALTHGNVQMSLKTGETTKAEVLDVFGAPNVTTRDGAGREVWSYQRSAQVAQSSKGSSYWTIIFAGGGRNADGFESSSRMMTLLIKFDANDKVVDFRSRTSTF